MTNNKLNINHTRFVRKRRRKNEGNNYDLTKEEDSQQKKTANQNWGKFFCRKIYTHLHQKGREGIRDTDRCPNWGKIFLSKNFGSQITRNERKKRYNTQLFKLGQIFLAKNLIQKRGWQRP